MIRVHGWYSSLAYGQDRAWGHATLALSENLAALSIAAELMSATNAIFVPMPNLKWCGPLRQSLEGSRRRSINRTSEADELLLSSRSR